MENEKIPSTKHYNDWLEDKKEKEQKQIEEHKQKCEAFKVMFDSMSTSEKFIEWLLTVKKTALVSDVQKDSQSGAVKLAVENFAFYEGLRYTWTNLVEPFLSEKIKIEIVRKECEDGRK